MRAKYTIWLVTALLLAIALLPSIAQAQSFGVSPAEVRIDGLPPGGEAKFDLTIYNHYNVARAFTLTTCHPWDKRPGRSGFPDDSWVSFSPQEIEIAANSQGRVKVTVAIPSNQKWADRDWEVWLGVAPQEKEFLVVNYYIRLLVSTSTEVKATSSLWLILGIIVGVILLCWGIYYLRRKIKET